MKALEIFQKKVLDLFYMSVWPACMLGAPCMPVGSCETGVIDGWEWNPDFLQELRVH